MEVDAFFQASAGMSGQQVDQTGFAYRIIILMPAAVISITGTGSDEYWLTHAAGKFRSRVMSGEDWAGGVTF